MTGISIGGCGGNKHSSDSNKSSPSPSQPNKDAIDIWNACADQGKYVKNNQCYEITDSDFHLAASGSIPLIITAGKTKSWAIELHDHVFEKEEKGDGYSVFSTYSKYFTSELQQQGPCDIKLNLSEMNWGWGELSVTAKNVGECTATISFSTKSSNPVTKFLELKFSIVEK